METEKILQLMCLLNILTTEDSPLPYWQSVLPDLSNEFRNEQEESKRKVEIHGVDEGDIAD
jgi:hypothetical protein